MKASIEIPKVSEAKPKRNITYPEVSTSQDFGGFVERRVPDERR
jgi:hypothetical protein